MDQFTKIIQLPTLKPFVPEMDHNSIATFFRAFNRAPTDSINLYHYTKKVEETVTLLQEITKRLDQLQSTLEQQQQQNPVTYTTQISPTPAITPAPGPVMMTNHQAMDTTQLYQQQYRPTQVPIYQTFYPQ